MNTIAVTLMNHHADMAWFGLMLGTKAFGRNLPGVDVEAFVCAVYQP